MNHRVVEIKVHGTRTKMLLRDDGMPSFYPNLFKTNQYARRALSTQEKALRATALLEEFLIYESIDLEGRLMKRPSEGLTDQEISRLVVDAAFKRETLDKKYSGVRLLDSAIEYVEGPHVNQRLDFIREYLKFLYETLADEASRYTLSAQVEKSLNRKIKSAKPAWKKTKVAQMKGLDTEQRNRLRAIAHYDSEENPFTTEATRLRNYIIVLLGMECGLRRSEMLLLKGNDIDYREREIIVRALTSDIEDPRVRAPGFKTAERKIRISEDLVFAIKDYVEKHRSRAAKARKHPFLLVSHRKYEGSPVSVGGLDSLLSQLASVEPALKGVTLHTLRHDCVYTLLESERERLDELTPEDRTTWIQKVLTWTFGWSPTSQMPQLYGAKFWHEEANRGMDERARHFAGLLESDDL